MFNRLINYLSVRLSNLKKLNIDLNNYFPLTVQNFKEYKGKYESKHDNFGFICIQENMKSPNMEGINTILQNRTYINDNGSILFSDEIVFGKLKEKVYEYSRYRDGKQTIHPIPMVYLDTYKKGQYPNNVFVFKSLKTQIFNGDELLCLYIKKVFYTSWRLQRIERMYLIKGVGMVKYEEESFYPYSFKLSYKISEDYSGYRIIKNDFFGNFLFNPNSEHLSGKVEIASNHWVDIYIATKEENKDEAIRNSERILTDIIKMEHFFREQISEELLDEHNDAWNEGESITSKEFAERIRLNSITLLDDGKMEAYFDDGDLFFGHIILAGLNNDMKLEHVDIIG